MEDGCEEVIFACGFACGGTEGCVGDNLGEFAVSGGVLVDEPAYAVSVAIAYSESIFEP